MPFQFGWKKRVKSAPPSIEAAYAYVAQNQLAEALELLNVILDQSPTNALALAMRGQTYGRLGNLANSLTDLRRSLELDPNNAEAHFNYAIALAKDNQESEALWEISRVVQLTPDDEEAWAWRKRLARALGLGELDQAAHVLEKFAYSQCGNGLHWEVALRQMHHFQPQLPPETYHAAVLHLHQAPRALLEVTTFPDEYRVKLTVERRFPEVKEVTFVEVIAETIPKEPSALFDLLQSLISRGFLKKVGDRLRYEPSASTT